MRNIAILLGLGIALVACDACDRKLEKAAAPPPSAVADAGPAPVTVTLVGTSAKVFATDAGAQARDAQAK